MSSRATILGILLVGGTAAMAQTSLAATFSGTATGSWGAYSGGAANSSPDVTETNHDANTAGVARLTFGTPSDNIGTNVFTFDGAGSDTSSIVSGFSAVSAGQVFDIGRFTYFNGTTGIGTNISAVSLGIALHLTAPADASPPNSSYNYNFGITVTPNTHDDSTPAGAAADADIVTISNGLTSTTFTSGGITYTLALLGFSTNGGTSYTTSFDSPERSTATADIFAVINQPSLLAVPEPAALSILGVGLVAAGIARVRRPA